jgi:hypothetical protein
MYNRIAPGIIGQKGFVPLGLNDHAMAENKLTENNLPKNFTISQAMPKNNKKMIISFKIIVL